MFRAKLIIVSLSIILLAFVTLANAKTSPVLGVNELMLKVEKNYSATKTFKSKFEQIYIGRHFGEIKSKGSVQFKKPGMMRWDYNKPHKKIIASHGNKLWIYDTADSQVILDKNFKRETLPSSLSFLWGEEKLSEVFKYKILNVTKWGKNRKYTVELIPKEEVPNIDRLHFVIISSDFLIHETSVFDLFGNENRLIFVSPKLGHKAKDSFFAFNPPKGVTIVEPPKRLER